MTEALGADVPQGMIEPGRFIVGNAGVLLAQVVNLKAVEDRKFAVLDAA